MTTDNTCTDAPLSPVLLQRLRVLGKVEALSFIVLMGAGMPLKYAMGMLLPMKIFGWVHGVLFMAFVALLIAVAIQRSWPLARTALVFVAALIPFGPFFIDRRLAVEAAGAADSHAETEPEGS